jgi:uncharacterized glyoxalase superfamily protein PhnB
MRKHPIPTRPETAESRRNPMNQRSDTIAETTTRPAWTLTGLLVNLYAEDVEPAVAFYSALGFEESYRVPATGTPLHVELRKDGTTIGVSSVDAARDEHGFEASQEGASVEITFWCDDTNAAYTHAIAAGAAVVREPYEFQNGRLRVARVTDPLGNPVVFVQKQESSS